MDRRTNAFRTKVGRVCLVWEVSISHSLQFLQDALNIGYSRVECVKTRARLKKRNYFLKDQNVLIAQ